MHIVLLSGGSGKRLWPLSNDTRSKQFLKLLQDNHGNYESMVQRVYRQIIDSGIAPKSIVVTTNAAQQDSISSQLGDNVEIILEPERRNTYPAIVLASAYLAFKKNCSQEEAVIVLPVDPYAQIEYFHTLKRMEQAVLDGENDLVLMGIDPSFPTEKYGYILPYAGQTAEPLKVEKFYEKPDLETARKLISEGAKWNGGVFAFKLGYLINILKNILHFDTYEELYARYGELSKNSFDYEVVEKANSIGMVSYKGTWKDLGTWNTLTEEMFSNYIGEKIIIGENSNNTHVINELNIPILVLGANNMVVAASADGILVSDKESSKYLKSYVDRIEQRPMFEERRWGEYKVIDFNTYDKTQTLTKHMFIKEGKNISYQTHSMRDEIWTIIDGTGDLLIDGHIRNVRRGDVAYIIKGQKHALKATTDLHFIEVQIGEQLIEEDVERFEWAW